MLGELRESQSTPVQEKKDKGKGKEKEVVKFSDIEELDGPPSSKELESKPRWGWNSCGLFVTTELFSFSNLGVLTPVDPLLRVGSAVIATDPVTEVDKAETILVKQVVRLASRLIIWGIDLIS